jgi:pimeloyl-ACP methyl ester carboxylesterase
VSGVVRIALILSIMLGSAGCRFGTLQRQLGELKRRAAHYGGSVSREAPSQAAILAVLYQGAEGAADARVASYDVLLLDSEYFVIAEAGEYRMLAFEDLNGDFIYQRDEPVGYLDGVARDLSVEGADAAGRIVIPRAGWTPPAFPIDLSQDALADILPRAASNLGAVVTLDDPRFSRSRASDGVWKPVDFIERVGVGLYLLEPHRAERTPVLLVHGLGGTPAEWDYVTAHLDRERFEPWLYHYPSGLPLSVTSRVLKELVEDLVVRHRVERVHLVAHSMGGLVSRAAILAAEPYGEEDIVDLFVSISTPWGGDASANLGAGAPVAVPVWKDMAPGSAFLRELFASPMPPDVDHRLLFTYAGNRRTTKQADDGVVALASQLIYPAQNGAAALYGLDETHTSVLRSPELVERLGRLLSERESRARAEP